MFPVASPAQDQLTEASSYFRYVDLSPAQWGWLGLWMGGVLLIACVVILGDCAGVWRRAPQRKIMAYYRPVASWCGRCRMLVEFECGHLGVARMRRSWGRCRDCGRMRT